MNSAASIGGPSRIVRFVLMPMTRLLHPVIVRPAGRKHSGMPNKPPTRGPLRATTAAGLAVDEPVSHDRS
jgi:hypothetical protein